MRGAKKEMSKQSPHKEEDGVGGSYVISCATPQRVALPELGSRSSNFSVFTCITSDTNKSLYISSLCVFAVFEQQGRAKKAMAPYGVNSVTLPDFSLTY